MTGVDPELRGAECGGQPSATHFLRKTLPKVATEMALCVLTYNFEGDTGTLPQLRLLSSILTNGLLTRSRQNLAPGRPSVRPASVRQPLKVVRTHPSMP